MFVYVCVCVRLRPDANELTSLHLCCRFSGLFSFRSPEASVGCRLCDCFVLLSQRSSDLWLSFTQRDRGLASLTTDHHPRWPPPPEPDADAFTPPTPPHLSQMGLRGVAAPSVNAGVFHPPVDAAAARCFLIFRPDSIFVTNGEFD